MSAPLAFGCLRIFFSFLFFLLLLALCVLATRRFRARACAERAVLLENVCVRCVRRRVRRRRGCARPTRHSYATRRHQIKRASAGCRGVAVAHHRAPHRVPPQVCVLVRAACCTRFHAPGESAAVVVGARARARNRHNRKFAATERIAKTLDRRSARGTDGDGGESNIDRRARRLCTSATPRS